MGVSKVEFRGTTLIDISGDTVTAASLAAGYTAHGSDGEPITGTGGGAGAMAQGNATKGTDGLGRQTLTVTGLSFQPTGGSIMAYVDTGISGIDQIFGVYGVVRIAGDWMFVCVEPTVSDGTAFILRGANAASPIGTVEVTSSGIKATITNTTYQFIGPNNSWYYDLRG